jgi:hypothetical protein
MSSDESPDIKIARLEERLIAAADAVKLAYANTHAIRAELLSVLAILVSIYAVFHK